MPNTIQISNNILDWVNASVALNDDARVTLDLWRSGKKQPTFNQLEAFSKKTRIPLGYFFLSSPPVENLGILEFRTDSSILQNPSRDLIDTVRKMEEIQEWMRDHLIASHSEKITFAGSLDAASGVYDLARAVRDLLALPEDWHNNFNKADDAFKSIRETISNSGVMVMMSGIVGLNTKRTLKLDEFRAFTLFDEYAPLIFINSTDTKSGMLFSLLHEFTHTCFGISSLFNSIDGESHFKEHHESVCNAVTAEILAPVEAFKEKWSSISGEIEEKTKAIASYFKCSQSVVLRRTLDSKYITNEEYQVLSKLASYITKASGARTGGDFYKTHASRIDPKFLHALHDGIQDGKTLHTEAFRLTNTNRSTFNDLYKKLLGERE
ncbi:MAG: ImmA/IrrE family metallo-endopeptidase [Eubacteriaceae bacterium]|nr:ImmA/IrrE family metallo-endopeptidase [Eubacteriaceae bacterium]